MSINLIPKPFRSFFYLSHINYRLNVISISTNLFTFAKLIKLIHTQMHKEFIISEDGSVTIFLPELNEHYHSRFGAFQESMHIFINNGIAAAGDKKSNIRILEVGFGTGLNAFLTAIYGLQHHLTIDYVGIEPFPLTADEVHQLNYTQLVDNKYTALFNHIVSPSDYQTDRFRLTKHTLTISDYLSLTTESQSFDLIYFDAFGPDVQPDLWHADIFKALFKLLSPDGFLITYSCKGLVKQALRDAGFTVKKLPGPKGKREITKAFIDRDRCKTI